ncbi:MAG: DUF4349 domain-containing protein [Caldilineaceae bacterium]|nr:DUF4349 domain-containing protein [Caldilineaceae bacterium]
MSQNRWRWTLVAGVALWLLAACASPMSREAASPASEPSFDVAPGDAVAQSADTGAVSADRKMIARANIDLTVSDPSTAVEAINALMDEVGGYVSASNLYKSSYDAAQRLQGNLTLRVPADRLDETLAALEKLAVDVPSRTMDREDVTDQYSDIDAQLRNLEATEAELREMLAEVRARPNATAEDIMAVYRTLTEVRGQIEQLRGQKNMLDNLISLSTIEVTLRPDSATLPVVEEGWRPLVVMREALRALVGAVQWLGNVAIWVVVFLLPLLILAAIPLVVFYFVVRWLIRRNRKPATPVTT